jgi:hypothetical protein
VFVGEGIMVESDGGSMTCVFVGEECGLGGLDCASVDVGGSSIFLF